MSEQQDAFQQRDEPDDEAADVEGHGLDAQDAKDQQDATEEAPDVEGHSLDAPAAVDAYDAKDAQD